MMDILSLHDLAVKFRNKQWMLVLLFTFLIQTSVVFEVMAADTTIKGTTTTSGVASLEVTDSDSATLLYVRNDGNVGIGTATPGAKLDVGGSHKATSIILEGGTYDTTIQPGTPTASVTYTLPAADGDDGQVLKTNSSGTLSWTTVAGAPIGSMMIWTTDTAPTGWLLCYGQAVSRTVTYDGLYAVIGTTFGVGDGGTTFNLPDMRGRFPLGQDDMGGSSANRVTHANADNIGGAEGAESHVLTIAELAVHNHPVRATNLEGNSQGPSGRLLANDSYISQDSYRSASYDVTMRAEMIGNTGSDTAHNNMSPYITLNYIIKY